MSPTLDRRQFLSLGAAGLAAVLLGCGDGGTVRRDDLSVIVVGAGPAGMTSAHLLNQAGVSFTVLEAAPTHGGRIKHTLDFVDFPIPLGAEWVHVEAGILDEIVNDESVDIDIELVPYSPSDSYGYFDGELVTDTIGDYRDLKFRDSSWLDFFDRFIVPGIADRITYNTQVVRIEHDDNGVTVTDAAGVAHSADAVVFTAPLKILQRGDVIFDPPLPEGHRQAIDRAEVWSGFKAFFEFSEAFYPTFLETPESDTAAGQLAYYDAAYGQSTPHNVLGVFSVGAPAERFQAMSDGAFTETVLGDLDEIFDGAATRTYLRHITQNWNEEPFAGAAYLSDYASVGTSRDLAAAVDGRVFFAGDAYTKFSDWSSVHTAARSAADAVAELLEI